MKKNEIKEKLNEFLKNRLEYDETLLVPEADLKEDIGMTSLDATEIGILINKAFGFMPNRGDIKMLTTLQDLYDYVEKNVEEKE